MVPGGKGIVKILVDGTLVAEIVSPNQRGEGKARMQWDSRTRQLLIQIVATPGVKVHLLPALQELSKRFSILAQVVEIPSLETLPLLSEEGFGGISLGTSMPELQPSTIEFVPIEFAKPHRVLPEAENLPLATPEISEPVPSTPEEEATVEDIARTVADVATDFIPGVSNIKDAAIALTGVNPVTGEEVGIGGRILSGIFAIPGLGNSVKYIVKGGKLLGKALVRIGQKIGKPVWQFAQRVGPWTAVKARQVWSWVTERLGKNSKKAKPLEEEGSSTLLAQPGGLKTSEGRQVTSSKGKPGKPSHPLKEHGPDVDPEHLKARVQKGEVDQASKFTDRAKMETAIGSALDSHGPEIVAWASQSKAGMNKAFSFNPGLGNLGLGYYRTSVGKVEIFPGILDKVWVILKADGKGSYVIQTAFPSHVLN
ncbi:MAG: Pre-toxin [Acidobacteriota bacterium]|jgi:hypothetical protein|nr:Pre-toxin [Acidobacteriota bacterium]